MEVGRYADAQLLRCLSSQLVSVTGSEHSRVIPTHKPAPCKQGGTGDDNLQAAICLACLAHLQVKEIRAINILADLQDSMVQL